MGLADKLAARYASMREGEDLLQVARLAELQGGSKSRIRGAMSDELRRSNIVRAPRKRAADGSRYMGQVIPVPVRDDIARCEPASMLRELTGRQIQIAKLICAGLPEREIAARLGVTENTVSTHRQRIYRKIGVLPSSKKKAGIKIYQALGKALIERIPCPQCGYKRGL